MNSCPLCLASDTRQLETSPQFYCCGNCTTIFRGRQYLLTPEEEKERYLLHENDVTDEAYQQFVTPVVEKVLSSFKPPAKGLDFGAGTGPVIAKLLGERGYEIALWDPFFHPDPVVLESKYDFIVCCEVIEHFHTPQAEFQLMKSLLKPGGQLICMTDPLPKDKSFKDWHYKNDPTHVIFYSEENIAWIKEHIGFSEAHLEGRLIVFRN